MIQAVDDARSRASDRGSEFVRGRSRPSAHREWFCDARVGGVLNHSTRSHIPGDIHRYLFAAAFAATNGYSPKLADLPAGLLPQHENIVGDPEKAIFADRFRVQLAERPSTTVTSHISKDGHYYIHFDPSQARSLTAREAARLQTFPDNYFFCGGRTSQYQQIGNAVPPLLARQIAHVVSEILTESGA
jgi:DNA (cytosine-5)-methyltransferase 1